MHRPGVELAISRSQVRRPNHYTTEPSPIGAFRAGSHRHVRCRRQSQLPVRRTGDGWRKANIDSLLVRLGAELDLLNAERHDVLMANNIQLVLAIHIHGSSQPQRTASRKLLGNSSREKTTSRNPFQYNQLVICTSLLQLSLFGLSGRLSFCWVPKRYQRCSCCCSSGVLVVFRFSKY